MCTPETNMICRLYQLHLNFKIKNCISFKMWKGANEMQSFYQWICIQGNPNLFSLLPLIAFTDHFYRHTYSSVSFETSEQHITFDQKSTIKLRTKVHTLCNNEGLSSLLLGIFTLCACKLFSVSKIMISIFNQWFLSLLGLSTCQNGIC